MKNIHILSILFFILCISCTTTNFPKHPRWLCNHRFYCLKHPKLVTPPVVEFTPFYDNSNNKYTFEDFPEEDVNSGNVDYSSSTRRGIIENGYKEGLWISAIYEYDTIKETESIRILFTKEYFKHGLRDSIFKQFDKDGNVIYETTFKMGTGLWKEFHSNGKIYFEAYTKDGYFTDTLKLYNSKGENFEKRLYQKDSLIFKTSSPLDANSIDN